MKKKVMILWIVFAVCLVLTVVLWFFMNGAEPEYEEVKAVVTSAKTEEIVNKKTGSRTKFYKVEVRYDGKVYDLENAHDTYTYPEGKTVTAYKYNDRLFANTEGVQTSTPVATIYFIFLFGSFIMLMVAATYTSKVSQEKKKANNEANSKTEN